MTVYKGFNKDLSCLGYQFVPGENLTDAANCRENGFHAAENPLDCLSYYPNMDESVYWLCDAGGDIDEDGLDSKVSCTKLILYKQMCMEEFVFHAIWYMMQHPSRKTNKLVCMDRGVAKESHQPFVIVRGNDPIAKGRLHDYLGLYRDGTFEATIIYIDGEKFKPDTWYDVHGNEVSDEDVE